MYINPQNWWAKSEGQHLDTGSSCVFDYTLPLKDRQAEMFKLSGNQTAERRETQTRDGRGRELPGNNDGGRGSWRSSLTNARPVRKDSDVLVSLSVFLALTSWSELILKYQARFTKANTCSSGILIQSLMVHQSKWLPWGTIRYRSYILKQTIQTIYQHYFSWAMRSYDGWKKKLTSLLN